MPALEVHVIGRGTGESIILGIPECDWWVVIDAYSANPQSADVNATIAFLRRRGVERLAFIALTHPHHDHYTGLAILFDHFEVDAFWQYDGMERRQLAGLLSGAADPLAPPNALIRLFETITKLARSKKLILRNLAPHTSPPTGLPRDIPLTITALSPSGLDKDAYLKSVTACFHADGGLITSRARQIAHNRIATALLVRFGQAGVLLGSDVESPAWKQILDEFEPDKLRSHVVKVSHHGSTNGYCDRLWSLLCPAPGIAIIAPSAGHELPEPEALDHIRPHVEHLLVTARPRHLRNVTDLLPLEDQLALSVFSSLRYETLDPSPHDVHDAHTCSLTLTFEGKVSKIATGAGVICDTRDPQGRRAISEGAFTFGRPPSANAPVG